MESYLPSHRLRDLLTDNVLLLPTLTRFEISLGFGDSTVAEVCENAGIDCNTFLAVCNYISDKPYDDSNLSLSSMVSYLKNAHSYFLDYMLPNIRQRLIGAISMGNNSDIALVILKFYDEYVAEVRRHMEYEDAKVFSYVGKLQRGIVQDGFAIGSFKDSHKPIAAKLKELKEVLIYHFTTDRAHVPQLNSLLLDIVVCERDMNAHCGFEDRIFIPAVERFESHTMTIAAETVAADVTHTGLDPNGDIVLTAREREIITCIARGYSNKEIADRLFLSVHTVATHRRNICAKLNIHSASGMTIFAILHGLISIDEGEMLIH